MEDGLHLKFASSIDLANLRIIRFSSFIFLCGGYVAKRGTKAPSARHFLYYLLKQRHKDIFNKIILAEDLTEWFKDNLYSDLCEFEDEIAGLASVIFIFVESPGSIAEFAYFASINKIAQKMVACVRSDNFNSNSFIKHGPVTALKKKYGRDTHAFPWKVYRRNGAEYVSKESFLDVAPDIVELLKNEIEANSVLTSKFNKNTPGHLLFLICDFIDIMHIVRAKDIKDFLTKVGLNEKCSNVDRSLQILEDVGLVLPVPYSTDKFYALGKSVDYIQYRFKDGSKFKNRVQWKVKFREWLESDRKRRIAFNSLQRK